MKAGRIAEVRQPAGNPIEIYEHQFSRYRFSRFVSALRARFCADAVAGNLDHSRRKRCGEASKRGSQAISHGLPLSYGPDSSLCVRPTLPWTPKSPRFSLRLGPWSITGRRTEQRLKVGRSRKEAPIARESKLVSRLAGFVLRGRKSCARVRPEEWMPQRRLFSEADDAADYLR